MASRMVVRGALAWLLCAVALLQTVRADDAQSDKLRAIVTKPEADSSDLELIRRLGPSALETLARLYERSNDEGKVRIAVVFYQLGLPSDAAKRVLMRDVHTQHERLRLQVQWALGRVSADDDVVDVLVDNMMHDENALFRDKAACGLASDQIHLSARQKARMLRMVIGALSSSNPQVRAIAVQVLKIQTGQADGKGFNPDGPEAERKLATARWAKWIAEYEANL